MSSLEKHSTLRRAQLSEEHYLLSLMEAASHTGLLGDEDTQRIRQQCLVLLAKRVERYNAGDSSSIRVEKATELLTCVFFTIGLQLKACPTPDEAVAVLLHQPVEALYLQGRKRIDTLLAATRSIHRKLVSQLVDTPNVFYHATLVDGILGFFKLYDPDYSAQEIHITADYPLLNPRPRLAGIEFIRAYLGGAFYENAFCAHFPAAQRHRLLSGYIRDYAELPINLYEVVLAAALGCVVAGTDPHGLEVTATRLEHLHRSFAAQPQDAVLATLAAAAESLVRQLGCTAGVAAYLRQSLPQLAPQMAQLSLQIHRG